MPVEIYEIVALAARFWFLFLMVLIVWRSYRWYARERRQRKKRLRLLPDAGYIGEFVVMQGAGDLEKGQVLSVPFEGTLGYVRSNDLCIPVPGVAGRHLWFSYDSKQGLVLTPIGRNDFAVDETTLEENPQGLCMAHGSRLFIGDCVLRLRMFAGYEVGLVMCPDPYEEQPSPDGQQDTMSQEQLFRLFSQSSGFDPFEEVSFNPAAYAGSDDEDRKLYDEAFEVPEEAFEEPVDDEPVRFEPEAEEEPVTQAPPAPQEDLVFHPLVVDDDWQEEDTLRFGNQPQGENIFAAAYRANTVKAAAERAKETARQKAGVPENRYQPPRPPEPVSRPQAEPAQPARSKPLMSHPASLTPPPRLNRSPKAPVAEPKDAWPTAPRSTGWRSEGLFDDLVDEDGTDASMPPKSAYVGQDEAAWAKRQVWDKYFGGGDAP